MAASGGGDRFLELLPDLSLAEKLSLVRGAADPAGRATGFISDIDRYDLPPISLVDGPVGIRDGEATAFPATG